jgi:hypothetical protein
MEHDPILASGLWEITCDPLHRSQVNRREDTPRLRGALDDSIPIRLQNRCAATLPRVSDPRSRLTER